MFKLQISKEIKHHCRNQLQNYDFGKRKEANGNMREQLTGILGQCVLMEQFNVGLIDGKDGFDDGLDIEFKGLRIDVKTMGRTCEPKLNYVNNFIGLQMGHNTDLFIFCSLNKKTCEVTVCGWIPKSEFKKRANFYKKGTKRTRTDGTSFFTKADLYEIENSKLFDVNSVEELKKSITQYYNV